MSKSAAKSFTVFQIKKLWTIHEKNIDEDWLESAFLREMSEFRRWKPFNFTSQSGDGDKIFPYSIKMQLYAQVVRALDFIKSDFSGNDDLTKFMIAKLLSIQNFCKYIKKVSPYATLKNHSFKL